MPGKEIKGRSKIANYRHGGRTGKQTGGRTNLLEELGRVEAEPSNRNRRAEISRVHGELNRGYKTGGRIGFKKGGFSIKTKKVKPGSDQEFTLQKGVSAAPIKQSKVKGKGLGSGIKPSEAKDILKSDKITRSEYLKQWSPHFGGRNLKKEMKAATKKSKK